jgi:hypothetical protein
MMDLLVWGQRNPPESPFTKGGLLGRPLAKRGVFGRSFAKGGLSLPPFIKGGLGGFPPKVRLLRRSFAKVGRSLPPFIKGGLGGFPPRLSTYRGILTAVMLIISALALAACYQPLPRDLVAEAGPHSTPQVEPTPSPTPPSPPTATPPPPTPTPTPPPTPTPEPTRPAPLDRPLFLDLEQPGFGATVGARTITVSGATLPGTTLEIGGQLVRVDPAGRFETQVTLTPGPNVIEVRATGLLGGQIREPILVTYAPPPPPPFRLEIHEPGPLVIVADQTIRVSGSTTVPQSIVTVNGVAVPVDDEGRFSTLVRLTEGVNEIEVLALHPDSRSLRGTRTVTYSPR